LALTHGTRLGVYQVTAQIGEGGMGQVYRARDTKLNRDVALKVLPDSFANDPDRLARFTREAQTLAALNHPNIAHIHGLEESGGVRALVMELVEGDDLSQRIARGAIPLDEALPITKQIAEALEAAHEQGIIHRDLKPANIKVRPDGTVKVLDFGLAKAVGGDGSTPDLSQSPTVTVGGTREGVMLGTAAYMSPEQARGKPVDKRTDIWAFGCVLYEALTGRLAFAGETISDTIVAILEREPDWDRLPGATPASIRVLLQRCLEKDPKRRLRDIGDARIEIDQLDSRSGRVAVLPPERELGRAAVTTEAAPSTRHWRPTYRAVGLLVLALLLLAGGVGLFYSMQPSAPATSVSEYTQITNFTDSAVAPGLSPDGRMVTFIRGGEFFLSAGQIYVKLLPNGESVRLTNEVGPKYGPVFTPDGSRIAYSQVTRVGTSASWDTWTVPVLGGQPTRLLPNASGLTWLTDQRVLFSEIKSGLHMGIVTTTEGRAESREIYFPEHERAMAHFSHASPDRHAVLVVEMDRTAAWQPCRLVPSDGSSPGRQVGPSGPCTSAAWSPDGKWMYFGASVGGSSHLWRQRFPDGTPEQITSGPTEEEGIALAPDGRSLVTSVGTGQSAIWMHDAAGERPISSEGYARAPHLSLDGKRVFYLLQQDSTASSAELRSVDLSSGKSDRLLPGISVRDYDISRDESEVAFTTTPREGESQIWLAFLDRRSAPRQLTRAGDQVSFGAKGTLVFRLLEKKANFLYRINRDGSERQRIVDTPILNKFGVSPDGEWVTAFAPVAGEDGSSKTMPAQTVAVPVHGGVAQKICGANCISKWSSDGSVFYVVIDGSTSATSPGKTLAIPVPAGKSLPDLPASGINLSAFGVELPGSRVIEHGSLSSGRDPSTYIFTKTNLQRNLFRIPLH
jgi:Tol biopolymer transport system component